MSRRHLTKLGAGLVLMCLATTGGAQEGETRVSIVISPTRFAFAPGFGGPTGAVAGEVRITRYFTRTVGAQLSAVAMVAGSQGSALAQCPAPGTGSGSCVSERTSPSGIWGGLASAIGSVGETGFRGSLGVGGFRASGYREGTMTSATSAALGLGGEWVPDGRSRLAPTVGVRVLLLASPIAGVRQIYLPGLGFTF